MRCAPSPSLGWRRHRLGGWWLVSCLVVSGALEAQQARVRGVVFDSVGRSVLVEAMVQFLGVSDRAARTSFATRTDSNGTFSLDSLPPGAYLVGFFHQAADSLGIDPAPRRVHLRPGTQDVDLGIPSPASLIRAMCGSGAPTDSTTLLFGHVRDARTEGVVEKAGVSVEWIETTVDRTGVKSRERREHAESRGSGFFSLCALPGDVPLLARAARGADSTGYVEVDVALGGVRHVTFYLGGSTRVATGSDADSLPTERWHGNARLTGSVVDASGAPVPGARAVLLGTGAEGVANSAGAFALDSLPSGSFTVEIRAIGYTPVRQLVQLLETRPLAIAMALGSRIFTLPTEIVRGEVVYSRHLEGFDRRRRTQFTGKFLSPRDIQGRPRTRLPVLLRGMPGVEVTLQGAYSMVVMRRPGAVAGLEYCAPSLYVDGLRDMTDDYDRHWSDDVMAVEVYVRPTQRPFEFADRNECGAIAVWRRPTSGLRPPGGA